jgi:DNA-directed RNA polymerase subunit H
MAKKTTTVYDVTKHHLVPEHKKLSEKDTEELLKDYSITAKELPKILSSDPAIQHLDVKEGDIIKITRENPHSGNSLFYRRVTNG